MMAKFGTNAIFMKERVFDVGYVVGCDSPCCARARILNGNEKVQEG